MRDDDLPTRECIDCGAAYVLVHQDYYGPRCPDCVPDDRSWPRCMKCGDRYEPGTSVSTWVSNPPAPDGRERVLVCSEECAGKM